MNAKQLQHLLSSNIRKAREALRMSQMDLAGKAGISVSYVNDLEHSRRWIGAETLTKIAEALDVEPYQLLLPASERQVMSTFELLAKLRHELKGSLVKEIEETFSGYLREK